jgi:uncharacterized membrane protein YjfL (UPF0719 family)
MSVTYFVSLKVVHLGDDAVALGVGGAIVGVGVPVGASVGVVVGVDGT